MIRNLSDNTAVAKRRVVVFDFDGTLGDTMPTICSTAREVLLEFGLREDELGDLTRLVGPPFPQAFMRYYGLSLEEAKDVTERYRKRYNHLGLEAWPVFEGVTDMLDELKSAGKRLVVASSKGHWLVSKAISDNGLTEVFDAICGKQNDETYTKADAIKDALAMLGVDVEDAVMVGDRENDVTGAHEVGIPCIGVLWGGAGYLDELKDAGCDIAVDTIDELTRVLLGENQ